VSVLLVVAGAAVGAPLRYVVDHLVRTRYGGRFPWGTLIVNLAGSALLGALAGAGTALPHPLAVLLGTGFCGALTTYSTFGYETVRLAGSRAYLPAAANVVISVVAGVGMAAAAYALVSGR
jgi:CrcB protein